jgi:hypothetical protein
LAKIEASGVKEMKLLSELSAVAKFRSSFCALPKFDQRVHPKIQVGYLQVGPDASHLLLSSSPDLFDIMEIFANRGSIGEGFQISCPVALGVPAMKRSSTIFLQIVIVLVGVAALALLLWEPHLEGVNKDATLFEIYFDDPFLALVYAGSIPFFMALYQAFQALAYVGRNEVFSPEVVKALRTIKYCALAIIGFVVVEEIVILVMNNGDSEDPGAPIFMGVLIAFPSIVVATAAAMFERILQNAVEIKSENDLTV